MKPLWVSFYTDDYSDCATALSESLVKHGLDFEVSPLTDLGSWDRNTHHKPVFLYDRMRDHPGRPVVWVDADAKVVEYPAILEEILPDSGRDLAVVRCEWPRGGRRPEVLSGTVWLSGSLASRALVDRWIELCDEQPQMWDQYALQRAIQEFEDKRALSVEWLPVSYAYIFDLHREAFPDVKPVIEHYQRSRRVRAMKP